jgi:hypothetical protein
MFDQVRLPIAIDVRFAHADGTLRAALIYRCQDGIAGGIGDVTRLADVHGNDFHSKRVYSLTPKLCAGAQVRGLRAVVTFFDAQWRAIVRVAARHFACE